MDTFDNDRLSANLILVPVSQVSISAPRWDCTPYMGLYVRHRCDEESRDHTSGSYRSLRLSISRDGAWIPLERLWLCCFRHICVTVTEKIPRMKPDRLSDEPSRLVNAFAGFDRTRVYRLIAVTAIVAGYADIHGGLVPRPLSLPLRILAARLAALRWREWWILVVVELLFSSSPGEILLAGYAG
jgi:hypothetical protein